MKIALCFNLELLERPRVFVSALVFGIHTVYTLGSALCVLYPKGREIDFQKKSFFPKNTYRRLVVNKNVECIYVASSRNLPSSTVYHVYSIYRD